MEEFVANESLGPFLSILDALYDEAYHESVEKHEGVAIGRLTSDFKFALRVTHFVECVH